MAEVSHEKCNIDRGTGPSTQVNGFVLGGAKGREKTGAKTHRQVKVIAEES